MKIRQLTEIISNILPLSQCVYGVCGFCIAYMQKNILVQYDLRSLLIYDLIFRKVLT